MSAPYRPGQPPWPEQQPNQPPPIEFRREEQPRPSRSALAWTLRIAGLVAIAVVSGLIWWYIQNDGSGETPTGLGGAGQERPAGEYDFTAELDNPRVDESCSGHAYGHIKDFLTDTSCERLVRNVYSTKIKGRLVYAGISVVRMADAKTAVKLRELTDTDATGNVNDLVREGVIEIKGLRALSGGDGYKSTQHGREVVIVEADYDPAKSKGGSQKELDGVCADALRLADDMLTDSGG